MKSFNRVVVALSLFALSSMAFADDQPQPQPQPQPQQAQATVPAPQPNDDPKHGFGYVGVGAKATFDSAVANSYGGVVIFGGGLSNKFDNKGITRYWLQGSLNGQVGENYWGTYYGGAGQGQFGVFVTPFKCGPYLGANARASIDLQFGSNDVGAGSLGASGEAGFSCRLQQTLLMIGALGGEGVMSTDTATAEGKQFGGVVRAAVGKQLMASGSVIFTPAEQNPGTGMPSALEAGMDVAYSFHPSSPWVVDAQAKYVQVNASSIDYGYLSSTGGQVMITFSKSWK